MTTSAFIKIICLLSLHYSPFAKADVVISSPLESKIIFSQKKIGKNYDPNSWGKIYFVKNGQTVDLSRSDRYYGVSDLSDLSSSGKYIKIFSVEGGYVEFADGERKYTDRAYCSIVDMRSGCIICDWHGADCAYAWNKNEDVLSNSKVDDTETFDISSVRPELINYKSNLPLLDKYKIRNLLRCDPPSKHNINIYQKLINDSRAERSKVIGSVNDFLNKVGERDVIKVKSYLFSNPEKEAKLKSYLIPGDNVKILNKSEDNKWINIGYVKANGEPLIAWVQRSAID